MQKEAYFHGKPCVTFRDQTEWIELVETGWNRLCPPAADSCIASALQGAAIEGRAYVELYGRGDAAERLIDSLVSGMDRRRLPREAVP